MAKVKMKSEFFDFINFSSQSPKESRKFKKIINICNNLFYGDYYEKGGKLKTKEELDKRMKDSLIDSFVGFWGKQDKEYIENKINSAEIDYNYQILGKNSISEYLQNKKAEYIKGKIYCENYISNMFTQISSELKNNAKNIKKLLSSSDEMVAGKCKYCLESLGYSQEDVVNPGKMKEFMSRVKVYSEMEQNYSDNPKVNKDMKKLESVVKEYAKALDQYYKENKNLITDVDGKPYENVLDFNNAVWYRDTISKYTVGHYFDNQDYLFTPSNDVCACAVGGSKIRLGSNALDWVIIHELSYNLDCCFRRSCYLIKEKGGKLKMGPIWDFDLGFGSFYRYQEGDWATIGTEGGYVGITWMNYLKEDEAFMEKLQNRWNNIKESLLENALTSIESMAIVIQPSAQMNFAVWDILGKSVPSQPNEHKKYNTYELQIERLKTFIENRYEWFDKQLNPG